MSVLIEGENLKKYYPMKTGFFSKEKMIVRAVDGVDIFIEKGETVGLAGESGCGKTTLGRLLLGLAKPTEGIVRFNGREISNMNKNEMRKLRCDTQIIFQDPYASLNPRKTVRQILSKPFKIHEDLKKDECEERVIDLLKEVGITPVELYIDRYPHEFSGGQRQRIVIARAIALHPKFIVADEPVASLDISIRAQILNLMKLLQRKFGLALLYVSHDLSVLRSLCDRVFIMYVGEFVETASTDDLFMNPLHPYTEALLSATPIPDPRRARSRKAFILEGEVASSIDPPAGCRFHPRCPIAIPRCAQEKPKLIDIGGGRSLSCHLKT